MPANSLLKLAATKPDYEDRQGHRSVSIVPSRRNSRVLKPYELPDILREVKKCNTLRGDGEHAWAPTPEGEHLVLTAGTVIFRNIPEYSGIFRNVSILTEYSDRVHALPMPTKIPTVCPQVFPSMVTSTIRAR